MAGSTNMILRGDIDPHAHQDHNRLHVFKFSGDVQGVITQLPASSHRIPSPQKLRAIIIGVHRITVQYRSKYINTCINTYLVYGIYIGPRVDKFN